MLCSWSFTCSSFLFILFVLKDLNLTSKEKIYWSTLLIAFMNHESNSFLSSILDQRPRIWVLNMDSVLQRVILTEAKQDFYWGVQNRKKNSPLLRRSKLKEKLTEKIQYLRYIHENYYNHILIIYNFSPKKIWMLQSKYQTCDGKPKNNTSGSQKQKKSSITSFPSCRTTNHLSFSRQIDHAPIDQL